MWDDCIETLGRRYFVVHKAIYIIQLDKIFCISLKTFRCIGIGERGLGAPMPEKLQKSTIVGQSVFGRDRAAIGLARAKAPPPTFHRHGLTLLQIEKLLFDEVEVKRFNVFLKKPRVLSQKNLITCNS